MTDNRLALERTILASILNDPRELSVYSGALRPEAFRDKLIRSAVETMHRLTINGDPVDVVAVGNMIGEPVEILRIAAMEPSTGAVGLLAKKLSEYNLRDTAETVKHRLENFDDPFEAVWVVQDAARKMESIINAHTVRGKEVMLRDYADYIRLNATGRIRRIGIGIPSFDRMCNGGLRLGDITFLGGTPSVGKTSFMLGCGINAAGNGHRVSYIQGEMPVNEIFERIEGIAMGHDITEVERGGFQEKLKEFSEMIIALPIEFSNTFERSAEMLMTRVRDAVEQGAKLIIIDYMQVFVLKGNARDEFSQIKFLSEALRKAALQHDVHLLIASSLNRIEVGASRLTLNSFYGGSQLGHDCAIGLILHSEPEKDSLDSERRRVYLDIVKNRSGQRGELSLLYHLKTQQFREEAVLEIGHEPPVDQRYEHDSDPF